MLLRELRCDVVLLRGASMYCIEQVRCGVLLLRELLQQKRQIKINWTRELAFLLYKYRDKMGGLGLNYNRLGTSND